MKRVLSGLFAILFVICFSLTASADEVTNVSLVTDEVLKNRLFTVDLMIDSEDVISASQMTILYDDSMVEFRDAKSECFDVETKNRDNAVDLVFVSPKGQKADELKALSLEFKCVGTGTSDISIKGCECLNEDCEKVSVSTLGLEITVDEKGISSRSKSTSTKKTKVSNEKSESSVIESTLDENGENIVVQAQKSRYWIIICCVALVVVLAALFFLGAIYTKRVDGKTELVDPRDEYFYDDES